MLFIYTCRQQCLQTCCFYVFVVVSGYTCIQSFTYISGLVKYFCTELLPYHNVWATAVFGGFYHNCNVDTIFTMTLHARLASLPSFMVSYGSVSELREFNLKKKKMKNFDF